MGWVGFALSTLLLVFVSRHVRGFVRHHAPFWARAGILIVGMTVGVLFGVAVHLLGRFAIEGGWTLLITFSAIGFVSVAYIGYMPDPILDWAKKAEQTAVIATVSYLIVTVSLFAIDPPA